MNRRINAKKKRLIISFFRKHSRRPSFVCNITLSRSICLTKKKYRFEKEGEGERERDACIAHLLHSKRVRSFFSPLLRHPYRSLSCMKTILFFCTFSFFFSARSLPSLLRFLVYRLTACEWSTDPIEIKLISF